jgi:hypothetical protein
MFNIVLFVQRIFMVHSCGTSSTVLHRDSLPKLICAQTNTCTLYLYVCPSYHVLLHTVHNVIPVQNVISGISTCRTELLWHQVKAYSSTELAKYSKRQSKGVIDKNSQCKFKSVVNSNKTTP